MPAVLVAPSGTQTTFDGAVRRVNRLTGPSPDTRPPLPVNAALAPLLPAGLPRGSAITVTGRPGGTSLALAMVGAASGSGSWCALVGLPPLPTEALLDFGFDLNRLAIIPAATLTNGAQLTALGALLDAVDVVVVRPPARVADGDVRRLLARTRSRAAVLVVLAADLQSWAGAQIRLQTHHVRWAGLDAVDPALPASGTAGGHGRLRCRQVAITRSGKGRPANSTRPVSLWLPSATGGVEAVEPPSVTPLDTPLRRAG